MPRRLRIHLPHGYYHVTLRGNHQQDLFVVDGDRSVLNGIVSRVVEKHGVRIHAYCWMTNHLHMLIQAGPNPLGEPMRQIAREFSRSMQSRMQTTGHYFERRYHSSLIDADSYLLELVRYIHLNPVRARLVKDPAQYRWSSHHAYLGTRPESWVTTDFVLGMFSAYPSQAVSAYCAFLATEQPEEWVPREEAKKLVSTSSRQRLDSGAQRASGRCEAKGALSDLIAEACRRFEVHMEQLDSPIRDPYLAKVRAWIAHQAKTRRIATMAAVARELGRDEATLRQAIRTYPNEVE